MRREPPAEFYERLLGDEVQEALRQMEQRGARHWAPGFVPNREIEAFMGREVDPEEEAMIKRELRVILDRCRRFHGETTDLS